MDHRCSSAEVEQRELFEVIRETQCGGVHIQRGSVCYQDWLFRGGWVLHDGPRQIGAGQRLDNKPTGPRVVVQKHDYATGREHFSLKFGPVAKEMERAEHHQRLVVFVKNLAPDLIRCNLIAAATATAAIPGDDAQAARLNRKPRLADTRHSAGSIRKPKSAAFFIRVILT